jgi:hypothetical protein
VANKESPHPYIPSAGMFVQTFAQLRKMFPAKVDAETLRKLSLAPGNESVVINALRFLGFIDDDGKKTPQASAVFSKHQDDAFAVELAKATKSAYGGLFDTVGDAAWEADRSTLIGYFRVHDETSELTATRQAIAFETLASLSGHRESVKAKPTGQRTAAKKAGSKKGAKERVIEAKKPENAPPPKPNSFEAKGNLGLTVRIEINLPAQGDQETYDRIFQSIKQNLLNG